MFRQVTPQLFVSPQISVEDVAVAAGQGIRTIINNRPEGESDDQTPGEAVAAACAGHGIAYVAIPVTHAGFSEPQVQSMVAALEQSAGPVLAYCRSGTRSTLLWALARAKSGDSADELARLAGNAGYDISPVRALMDMLSAGK